MNPGMLIIRGNPRIAVLGLIVSLAIFAVVYFTVIKPSNDTANHAVRVGEQQAQQVLKNAQKNGVQVPERAKKLTQCIAAAGTDQGKLADCQSKFAAQ
jgi:hypothetical protein